MLESENFWIDLQKTGFGSIRPGGKARESSARKNWSSGASSEAESSGKRLSEPDQSETVSTKYPFNVIHHSFIAFLFLAHCTVILNSMKKGYFYSIFLCYYCNWC